ncbi:MAG TPA: hypothetical protein PLH54_00630 [Syntrophales bacterium]|nr:hypothetical protein [Syntrophales bacterium]
MTPGAVWTASSLDPEVLLERKLKACRLFLATTTKLKAALAEEEEGAAAGQLLQDREELIRVIGILDHLIERESPSPVVRQNAPGNACRRKILETLQAIEIENQACARLSAARRRDLLDRLAGLRQQGQGIKEYSSPGEGPPKFISCKS